MSYGWIKLHRSIKDRSWYKKSDVVHLLTHILLSASHKASSFYFNGSSIDLEPGELVTGRNKLALETGIKESRITRILELLVKEEIISKRGTNRYSIISVLNWSKYQEKSEHPANIQKDKKRTSSEHPVEQLEVNKDKGSREKANIQKGKKRTSSEHPVIKKADTIQEGQEVKEVKNKRKEEERALIHLEAAKKMLQFLEGNSGARDALIWAAKYEGGPQEFEEEVGRFFAYYADNTYFVNDCIRSPYKYTGKLQKWLSTSKNFKPKKIDNENKKGISSDFKGKLKNSLKDW